MGIRDLRQAPVIRFIGAGKTERGPVSRTDGGIGPDDGCDVHRIACGITHDHVGTQDGPFGPTGFMAGLQFTLLRKIEIRADRTGVFIFVKRRGNRAKMHPIHLGALIQDNPPQRCASVLQSIQQVAQHGRIARILPGQPATGAIGGIEQVRAVRCRFQRLSRLRGIGQVRADIAMAARQATGFPAGCAGQFLQQGLANDTVRACDKCFVNQFRPPCCNMPTQPIIAFRIPVPSAG